MAKPNFNPFGNPFGSPFKFFKSLFKENRMTFVDPVPEPVPGGAVPERPLGDQIDDLEVQRKALERKKLEEEAKNKGVTVREFLRLRQEESLPTRDRKSQQLQRLKRMDLGVMRRSMNINPELFEHQSKEKLDKLVDTLKGTGVIDRNDLEWMKNQLSYSFDPEMTSTHTTDLIRAYQFPEAGNNEDLIMKDAPQNGRGGEYFILAYIYLKEIKKILTEQKDSHVNLDEAQREKERDPFFVKATDKIQEIGTNMIKAVEERDYPKIALYGVAAYAFYRIYKQFSESSSSLAAKFKKYLPWAVAGYCGMAIFAPDKLKEILGKGTNIDIKGTAFATMDSMVKRSPEAWIKGIDVGLSARLADVPVKTLFEALNSDPEAIKKGMVHLTHSGFAGFLPADVVAARPPDGYPGPFSGKQKLYNQTAERLFTTLQGYKRLYEMNVYPKEGVTFEEKFMSQTSMPYTMHDLADQLSVFTVNFRPMFWDPKLVAEAGELFEGPGKIFEDSKAFHILRNIPGTPDLEATYMGFPIIVRASDTPEGRVYNFYLKNDSGYGAVPVSVYNSTSQNKESFVNGLDQAVRSRVARLLKGVVVAGQEDNLKYDDSTGTWSGTIKMPAVEKFGLPEMDSNVTVEFQEGKRAIITSDLAKSPIYVDEMMALRNHYGSRVLAELLGDDYFKPLNAFAEAGQIQFEDIPESKSDFLLILSDGMEVKMSYDKNTKRFSMDKTKEKELVKSSTFRRAYLDSVKDGPDFRVFDEMKGLVKYMPENYHIQFVQGLWHWITDASLDAPLSGISSDLISGSLPDYYTNMLIDSKKNQMLAILDRRLQTCKSFSDITSKEKSVNTRLFEIGAFYRQIMQNLKPESGKTFGRDEFMTKVIDPLKDVGTDSFRYKNRYRSVEGYVFEAIVRKGGDAASPSRHLTAARVMNVYSHFTAWLDDTELFTMANGGRMSATSKEVFDAEKPLEPGVVEPGLVAPKTEWEEVPARIYSLDDVNPNGTLPAHVNQADQYMYYVEKQITQKLPAFLEDGISPEKIPVAQNWGIKEFETWRRTEMVSNPLDPMASEPALTHDPNVPFSLATPEDWSQLEKNLNNAYYDVHQELLKKFEGIEIPNLQNYFTEYFEPDKDRVSQFRQDADMIYSGSSTKRDQLNLITSYAARFKEYLKKMVELENPGFWESAMETLGIS